MRIGNGRTVQCPVSITSWSRTERNGERRSYSCTSRHRRRDATGVGHDAMAYGGGSVWLPATDGRLRRAPVATGRQAVRPRAESFQNIFVFRISGSVVNARNECSCGTTRAEQSRYQNRGRRCGAASGRGYDDRPCRFARRRADRPARGADSDRKQTSGENMAIQRRKMPSECLFLS